MNACGRLGLVALLSTLTGCSLLKPETGGELHVGRPQVFSRERLLNERLGDINWLREQRKKDVEPSFQAIQDMRSARALVVQVGIQLDVLKGRQNAELSQAQHDINMETLRQRQQDLINRVKPAAGDAPADDSLRKDVQKLQADVKELGEKIDKLTKAADAPARPPAGSARGLLDPANSRTLNPKDAATTDAQLTSKERIDDQLAHRDNLGANIRDKTLDDSHDLSGATLYELKFDVTFVPGTNTRRFLLARLKVADPVPDAEKIVTLEFVKRVVTVLDEEMNQFSKRLHDRVLHGALSETWKRRVLSRIGSVEIQEARDKCDLPRERIISAYEQFARPQSRATTPRRSGEEAMREERRALSCFVAIFIKNRFKEPFDEYFKFEVVPVELARNDSRLYKIDVAQKPDAQAEMKKAVIRLHGENPVRVATIEPKEYVQNISDVGSRNEASQIGLALNLTAVKGADVSSAIERFAQNQRMLQTIKRQPLAVSFLEGQASFGWLLGPKFTIDKKQDVAFVHTPARYVFTASVAVPGWFQSLNLTGQGCWISGEGKASDCFDLFANDKRVTAEKTVEKTVVVNLPSHYHRAFIPGLLRHGQEILREPEIFLLPEQYRDTTLALRAASEQCLGSATLKACEQQIVIEGRELWRNPEVYIGNQKADTVELLPSMRGIVATFRALKPSLVGPEKQRVADDLLVVTSIGSDRLPGAVTVIPDVGSIPKPFMRPRVSYIDKVGDKAVLEFGFDPAAVPASYYSVLGRIRPLGTREWKDLGTPARAAPGVARFEFEPAQGGLGNKAIQTEVDVGMRFNPEDDFHSVLDAGLRHMTYFPNVAERSVTARSKAALDFSASTSVGAKDLAQLKDRLTFQFAKDEKLFLEAYPGLLSALDGSGGNARLLITSDDGPSVALDLQRTTVGKATAAMPTTASMKEAAKLVPREENTGAYNIALQYRLGNGEWQPVRLNDGDSLSIKGLKKPEPPKKPPVG
jgi:hypothetical protein